MSRGPCNGVTGLLQVILVIVFNFPGKCGGGRADGCTSVRCRIKWERLTHNVRISVISHVMSGVGVDSDIGFGTGRDSCK